MDPLVILLSLIGPFLVWPIEILLPYPFIIEELFKSFVVWFGPKKIGLYILGGFLFALTETVFYSININITGDVKYLILRLIITSILHSVTFSVIYLSSKRFKWMIIAGFLISVLIHFLYNNYVNVITT